MCTIHTGIGLKPHAGSNTSLVDYSSFMFLFIVYKVIHIEVQLWFFCGDRTNQVPHLLSGCGVQSLPHGLSGI